MAHSMLPGAVNDVLRLSRQSRWCQECDDEADQILDLVLQCSLCLSPPPHARAGLLL